MAQTDPDWVTVPKRMKYYHWTCTWWPQLLMHIVMSLLMCSKGRVLQLGSLAKILWSGRETSIYKDNIGRQVPGMTNWQIPTLNPFPLCPLKAIYFWVLWSRSLPVICFPFLLYTSLVISAAVSAHWLSTSFSLFPDHLKHYQVNNLVLQFWSYLHITQKSSWWRISIIKIYWLLRFGSYDLSRAWGGAK